MVSFLREGMPLIMTVSPWDGVDRVHMPEAGWAARVSAIVGASTSSMTTLGITESHGQLEKDLVGYHAGTTSAANASCTWRETCTAQTDAKRTPQYRTVQMQLYSTNLIVGFKAVYRGFGAGPEATE